MKVSEGFGKKMIQKSDCNTQKRPKNRIGINTHALFHLSYQIKGEQSDLVYFSVSNVSKKT